MGRGCTSNPGPTSYGRRNPWGVRVIVHVLLKLTWGFRVSSVIGRACDHSFSAQAVLNGVGAFILSSGYQEGRISSRCSCSIESPGWSIVTDLGHEFPRAPPSKTKCRVSNWTSDDQECGAAHLVVARQQASAARPH